MGVLDDFMVNPYISLLDKMQGGSCCTFRYKFAPR